MAEVPSGVLAERRGLGQELYIEGMQKSGPDKARVLPFIKGPVIVEGGPGSGVVTGLMSDDERLSGSDIYAVDISDDMIRRLTEKFSTNPKIHVVKHDVVNFDPGVMVNTYVHVSNIHEICSVSGYEAVRQMLANEFKHTREGGRIVIRDGVQPPPETVFVGPKTDFGVERFFKFVEGFKKVRDVKYQIGTFHPETLVWLPSRSNSKIDLGKSYIRMHSWNSSELLSKYHYPEINLPVELSEKFGIWTLKNYQKEVEKVGYKIYHAESYLIPFLLENHYTIDFDYLRLDKNGVPTHAPYPDSTMLLVGEKQ